MSFQQEIDNAIKEKRLYFVGDRLPSDWYEAFRLWLPLAEAGDHKAQFNIGRCYSRGEGTDKDSAKSIEWYLKAEAQGDQRAPFNLYLVHTDSAKEAEWFAKAVELGDPRALDKIEKDKLEKLKAEEKVSTDAIKDKAWSLLIAGDRKSAKDLYIQLAGKGDEQIEFALVACDLDLSLEFSSTRNYYSYNAAVVNGNGGGTRTSSYDNPTLVFKVKNNSPKAALVSVWLAKYDSGQQEKKIGNDIRLDFPSLQPGEMWESKFEIFDSKGIELVYMLGYSIHNQAFDKWIHVVYPEKVLIWEIYFAKHLEGIVAYCFGFMVVLFFSLIMSGGITFLATGIGAAVGFPQVVQMVISMTIFSILLIYFQKKWFFKAIKMAADGKAKAKKGVSTGLAT